jgi:hypothetical protein
VIKPEMLESTTALDFASLGLDGDDRRTSTIGAVHQLLDRVRKASIASTASPLAALDPRRASMAQQVLRQQSIVSPDGASSSILFTPPEGYGPRHASYVFTMDGGGQLLQDVVRVEAGADADEVDGQEVNTYPGMDITLDILHADTEELKKLFLMKLASALASYGCPTHRIDYNLHHVSEALGLCSSYFSLPPTTMISFQHQSEVCTRRMHAAARLTRSQGPSALWGCRASFGRRRTLTLSGARGVTTWRSWRAWMRCATRS